MLKYAQIANEETGLCYVGIGTDTKYYEKIGMTLLDVEQSEVDGAWYLTEKCPHYTEEERQALRRQAFEKEFFNTSLGYIRRKVSMATGETKDFICDIVPALQSGLALGIASPIITYNQPDFTQDITDEYMISLQEVKPVTAEFLKECAMQLANDFMPQGLSITEA